MISRISDRLPESWRPWATDLAISAVFVIAALATVFFDSADRGSKAVTLPVALTIAAALAWRRRTPAPSLIVLALAGVVQEIFLRDSLPIFFLVAVLLSVFSAASELALRPAVYVGLVAVALAEVISLLDRTAITSDKEFTAIVLVGLPWLAGRATRRQVDRSAQLSTLNERLRIERDERARAAVAAERVRIARDLHDVIAHSVSVMIVQAGAAEQVLAADPARAAEPLQAIRATGKAALDDMRRLLGVMRTDADPAAMAPQPMLSDLPSLAERFSAAGLPVHLAIHGHNDALAPGIEMTAYRVCQEALTNALKHGGGQATLTLALSGEAVQIDVVDDGRGEDGDSGGAIATGGHGLVGMRERVALYGGELHAGRRPEGGYAVRARLPREHVPA